MAELRALNSIVSSLRGVDKSTSSFKQAANDNQRNMSKIVKDLTNMSVGQKRELSNLTNTLDDITTSNQQNAARISTTNSLLESSLTLQRTMVNELKSLKTLFEVLSKNSSSSSSGESSVISGSALGSSLTKLRNVGLGALKVGAIGAAGVVGGGATANQILENQRSRGLTGAGLAGSFQQTNTNYTGKEAEAKQAAENYLGKPIKPEEWSELVRATSAEAGRKNQTEVAMVMATILNRARDKDKSISEILRERNQFQAVTGTRNNPNPSPNFVNAPDGKRLEQIFGAATNILGEVSREQRNFTAANAKAYGAGTNIGFRDNMIARGGSTVGGSVFNTAPPSISSSPATAGSTSRSTDTENAQQETPDAGAIPQGDIVSLGKYLQNQGIRVSEHPAFGGVGRHAPNSAHYSGRAIDLNIGHGIKESADPVHGKRFDELAKKLEAAGYKVIWRKPGHEGHMHVQAGGGNSAMYGAPRGESMQGQRGQQVGNSYGAMSQPMNIMQSLMGGTMGMQQMPGMMNSPMGMGMGANPISSILGAFGGGGFGGSPMASGIFGILQNILPPLLNSFQQPERPDQRASLEQPSEKKAQPTTVSPMPPKKPPVYTVPTEETSRKEAGPSATEADTSSQYNSQQMSYSQNQSDPIDSASKLLEQIAYNYGLGGKIPGVFV
jgi:hypothetical protein